MYSMVFVKIRACFILCSSVKLKFSKNRNLKERNKPLLSFIEINIKYLLAVSCRQSERAAQNVLR